MNRISVRGVAVASATAVTAVGAVVGVASGDTKPASSVADVAGSTLLADIPSGSQAQTISDNVAAQADAQQADATAAAQKAAAEAARVKAAADATAKANAEKAAAAAKAAKAAHDAAAAASRASTRAALAQTFSPGSVQALAQSIIGNATQFQCFSNIVTRESGWNYTATNAGSGAYGLVQALPGDKMASVGSDWRTNPATQIKWGLGYMNSRYGSPCGAWDFWQAHSWY
ncbi:lytic transglycosylase domain-containing protein [Streptacidiphilus sp. EB129]|uniref:aggregation-promoting factor C-terminal-like domain-containing protein n=1 Tax=Streptacidiphilus sp. EB129 TaxID=3156262 RepID=UPI003513C194